MSSRLTNDKTEFLEIIKQIHYDCHLLCKQAFGKFLPIAGNIGIFCQDKNEYASLSKISKDLTEPSYNPNQKYFLIKDSIFVPSTTGIPDHTYTHLYIRKPDPTPYGLYRGDIDFILSSDQYVDLKNLLLDGAIMPGAQIYDRPGWDMIQLTDPNMSSVMYVCTKEMASKIRVKI